MEAIKGSWGLLLAGEEKGRHGGAAGELGSPGGQGAGRAGRTPALERCSGGSEAPHGDIRRL